MSRHICKLYSKDEMNQEAKTCKEKIKRFFKRIILVSSKNPRTAIYFRSDTEIRRERKRQLESKEKVIHPLSEFRIYYELAMLFGFLTHLMATPWEMYYDAIYADEDFSAAFIHLVLAFLFSVTDMAVTFYTGYTNEETKEVIMELKHIRREYSRSWIFFFDLIATLPIELLVSNLTLDQAHHIRWLHILCFFRLFRLPTTIIYLNNAVDLWNITPNVHLLCRYTIYSTLVLHWTACLGAVISKYCYNYNTSRTQQNWIQAADIQLGGHPLRDYVKVLFRTAAQLLGVSHGLYPNLTMEDKVLTVIVFTVGYFLMGFVLIVTLQMVMSNAIGEITNFSFLNELDVYMDRIKLPAQKQKKLINYYQYQYKGYSCLDNNAVKLLSDRLQHEIAIFTYRPFLKNVKLLSQLPQENLDRMLKHLRREVFMPGDHIVRYGSIGNSMFFIISGTIAINTYYGVEVCHLHDGAYFGEIALVVEDSKRTTDAVALEICEICVLERKHFLKCVDLESDAYKHLLHQATERQKHLEQLNDVHLAQYMRKTILYRGKSSSRSLVKKKTSFA